jgi:ABC-2 type transport system permease protein
VSGVLTIYRRELAGLFVRPLACVLLVIALLFLGYVHSFLIVPFARGDVDQAVRFGLGEGLPFWLLLMLLPPLLTMRMISEEARSGLLEFLLTAPVRDVAVVLGKLGAATTFMALMWAVVPLHALTMDWIGTVPAGGVDWSAVWTGYVGAVLVSALLSAIGLAISAATATPLVAGFLSFVINLLLVQFLPLLGSVGGLDPEHWLRPVLAHLNVVSQQQGSFMLGVIDTRAVLFFLIWTSFFVFLATRLLEMRRWR